MNYFKKYIQLRAQKNDYVDPIRFSNTEPNVNKRPAVLSEAIE